MTNPRVEQQVWLMHHQECFLWRTQKYRYAARKLVAEMQPNLPKNAQNKIAARLMRDLYNEGTLPPRYPVPAINAPCFYYNAEGYGMEVWPDGRTFYSD